MRRSDREITELAEIIDIMRRNIVLRLGMTDGNRPYIVPLNYGFEQTDSGIVIYMHGAAAGHKLDCICANPQVCFEIDCSHKLIVMDNPGEYSMEYESVIGFGRAALVSDARGKQHGLSVMMESVTPDFKEHAFPEKLVEKTAVIRLDVESVTGKRHFK